MLQLQFFVPFGQTVPAATAIIKFKYARLFQLICHHNYNILKEKNNIFLRLVIKTQKYIYYSGVVKPLVRQIENQQFGVRKPDDYICGGAAVPEFYCWDRRRLKTVLLTLCRIHSVIAPIFCPIGGDNPPRQ